MDKANEGGLNVEVGRAGERNGGKVGTTLTEQ